jgi:hypothetical protein
MRISVILLVAFVVMLPVPAAAEGSTGSCEMTITASNTFYNKAGATNSCSGQISGYYIDNQFYISGEYHQAVEYSGQKFTVYLESSENTKDILTVYTQGKKEPEPEPERSEPEPKPAPKPEPEPEPEPVQETEDNGDREKDAESSEKTVTDDSSNFSSAEVTSETKSTPSSTYDYMEQEAEDDDRLDSSDTRETESPEKPEESAAEENEIKEDELNDESLEKKQEDEFSTVKLKEKEEKSAEENEVKDKDDHTEDNEVASLVQTNGDEGHSNILTLSIISLAVFAGGLIAYFFKPITRLLGKRK